jgi:hypothetical protein
MARKSYVSGYRRIFPWPTTLVGGYVTVVDPKNER